MHTADFDGWPIVIRRGDSIIALVHCEETAGSPHLPAAQAQAAAQLIVDRLNENRT